MAGDASDISGNDNTGSPSAGVYFGPVGRFRHVGPNITGDYWTLTYSAALKVADLTISAWYCSADTSAWAVFFSCGGIYIAPTYYVWYGYYFGISAGKLTLKIQDRALTGTMAINDGKWHRITATRNDSVARLYVDGRLDAAWNTPYEIQYLIHSPANYAYAGAFIAASHRAMSAPSTPGNSPATGVLSDIRVMNRAVSPDEERMTYMLQTGVV
jgi:hypothetical protein